LIFIVFLLILVMVATASSDGTAVPRAQGLGLACRISDSALPLEGNLVVMWLSFPDPEIGFNRITDESGLLMRGHSGF